MGGPAAAGSVVGDRGSSAEYQVRISDNSEVTQAVGGGKFAKVCEPHGREQLPQAPGGAGRTQRDLCPGRSAHTLSRD